MNVDALTATIERAATEVGRFRRRVHADAQLARFVYLADRLANELELALRILAPTAAELVACTYPDDDETADAAIEHVDRRAKEIRNLLGDRKTA